MKIIIFLMVLTGLNSHGQKSFKKIREMYAHIKEITGESEYHNMKHDINGDKKPDFFIGVKCNDFNPCVYYLFISEANHFVQQGTILLQDNKFEILKKTHHGLNDIFYYQEKSSSQGTIMRYEFDGKEYAVKTSFTGKYQLESLLNTLN